MPDPTTGVSTGADPAVSLLSQQQGTTASPLVNPAQSLPLATASSSAQQHQQDVSGLMATYDKRIRDLMSEKDKAINERNQAIAQLADLQKNYTDERAQTHQSLTNTATAAQTAIDQARLYENQVKTLEGQLLRANTLLNKPHLAPYADFIHPTSDAEQMQQLVNKLEEIRNDDLKRSGVLSPFGQGQQGQQTQGVPNLQGVSSSSLQSSLPPNIAGMTTNLPTQLQQAGVNPMSLYANRPNLAPGLGLPSSSPAQMHPAGAGSPTQSIQLMLADALKSGDSAAYERAVQQAAVIANNAINSQIGR